MSRVAWSILGEQLGVRANKASQDKGQIQGHPWVLSPPDPGSGSTRPWILGLPDLESNSPRVQQTTPLSPQSMRPRPCIWGFT